ncbi:MAG: hypothetical protein IT305_17055 [Chloroflexi bacterium]|nr:hypothetical protein [Chloroflexota bacterium]
MLSSLGALGVSVLLAGCEPRLPGVPTPLSTLAPSRERIEALPPATPPAMPTTPVGVTFGRVVRLDGVTIERERVRPGEELRLWLYWRSVEPAEEDLRAFGQIVGEGGRIAAREDDQIGQRRHLLRKWKPGDTGVDEMRIKISSKTLPAEYGVSVGVLRPDNQTHVPLTTQAGTATVWEEDAILVGTIQVVQG